MRRHKTQLDQEAEQEPRCKYDLFDHDVCTYYREPEDKACFHCIFQGLREAIDNADGATAMHNIYRLIKYYEDKK